MNMTLKNPFQPRGKATPAIGAVAAVALTTVLLLSASGQPANTNAPPGPSSASNAAPATVTLASNQLQAIQIASVGTHTFLIEKQAVGFIDYDEDLSVQVFSSYQGKIITNFFNLGDDVKKGQTIYTIDSPDLVSAESTLIAAVEANVLYSNELVRATALYKTNGVAQRELEQATSDAHTAEGAYKAARDAVCVFGKTEEEISQIEANRKIDPVLVISSPLSGRITARFAQPGLLVQPGSVPAPYTVSDLTTKWMVANVAESDSMAIRVGQPVKAKLLAWPGHVFEGKVSQLGTSLDPNVHRVVVRCDIADTNDQLRPNMLANFTIAVLDPIVAVAIPTAGVDRNSDGTFEAWVTVDRHVFAQRRVEIGMERDGYYQVLDGLRAGELAVTEGAVFISNILYAPPSD
ncbi:MAG: efflux RND transporter periplasmic adaptor subunit [Verrucomicrobiota bacterium]|jgi:cobalt-zinc-cadmium efflux system membrane fusion protein